MVAATNPPAQIKFSPNGVNEGFLPNTLAFRRIFTYSL
jgi:hypothetical protein